LLHLFGRGSSEKKPVGAKKGLGKCPKGDLEGPLGRQGWTGGLTF